MKNNFLRLAGIFSLILLVFLLAGCSEEDKTLRVGITSDIHRCEISYPGAVTAETFQKISDSFWQAVTDFNIDLGDQVSFRAGEKCHETAREDFLWVRDNFKTKSPLYFALGDHDIDDHETYKLWLEKSGLEKTYYSFDAKDVHIIVMDAVTGGNPILPKCESDPECESYRIKYEEYREISNSGDSQKVGEYLKSNNLTVEEVDNKKKEYKDLYFEREKAVKSTYDKFDWNKGQISEAQMEWIKNDIKNTKKKKILLFGHQPLFYFEFEDRIYDVPNRDKLIQVLKESGREAVVISGEVHTWHEEKIDGIQFYTMNQLKTPPNKNWAIFEWGKGGYKLEKITGEN